MSNFYLLSQDSVTNLAALVAASSRKDPAPINDQGKRGLPQRQWFWGIIQNAGPDSEADYTDNRYWFKSAYVSNTGSLPTDGTAVSLSAYAGGSPWLVWSTCTAIGTNGSGHVLSVGTYVQVYYDYDASTPAVPRYVIEGAVAPGGILSGPVTGVTECAGYVTVEIGDVVWRVLIYVPLDQCPKKQIEEGDTIYFFPIDATQDGTIDDPKVGVGVGLNVGGLQTSADATQIINKTDNINITNTINSRKDFDLVAAQYGPTACSTLTQLNTEWRGLQVQNYTDEPVDGVRLVQWFHPPGTDYTGSDITLYSVPTVTYSHDFTSTADPTDTATRYAKAQVEWNIGLSADKVWVQWNGTTIQHIGPDLTSMLDAGLMSGNITIDTSSSAGWVTLNLFPDQLEIDEKGHVFDLGLVLDPIPDSNDTANTPGLRIPIKKMTVITAISTGVLQPDCTVAFTTTTADVWVIDPDSTNPFGH